MPEPPPALKALGGLAADGATTLNSYPLAARLDPPETKDL
jgi:hypothetical protein